MSEEVKDAAKSVSKAMLIIYFVNFLLVFSVVLTLCYHMPLAIEALGDPILYRAIYVLRLSISPGWLIGMLVVNIFLLTCSNISYLASVARDIFAFARDEGLSFSKRIAHTKPKRKIPQNAFIVTSILSFALDRSTLAARSPSTPSHPSVRLLCFKGAVSPSAISSGEE